MVLGHNGERQVIVAGGYRYNSDMAQYIMRSTVDVFSLDMQHWRVGRDMPDARTTQVWCRHLNHLNTWGSRALYAWLPPLVKVLLKLVHFTPIKLYIKPEFVCLNCFTCLTGVLEHFTKPRFIAFL